MSRLAVATVVASLFFASSAAGADEPPPVPSANSAASGVDSNAATEGTPAVPAHTQQPRAFGHVLGDVLTQRVLLQHAGRTLEPGALPPADRVGIWFERRAPRIDTDGDGQRWLVIDHQVINAPRVQTATTLPALVLATTAGTRLAVPAWPVSIGPLTGPDATPLKGALALQPDRPVAPRATRPLERQLQASLIALAVVLCAWLAWWAWRQMIEAQRLPFARAERELRRLDVADPAAWLAVHQAINQTAGRVVHAESLPRLLVDAPHLGPLKAQLERFFQASNARFFDDAAGASAFPLRELGRALRAAEKRHQH